MLEGQVLVLNRSWVVVHVTPMRRALTLLFQGHARVVHPKDYRLYDFDNWCELSRFKGNFESGRYIHTPSFQIRLPEVILLSTFNGFVKREVRLSRRNIFERDEQRCQYCGQRLPKQELTIDHVLPRSRGGRDTWENLVLACLRCNLKKGSKTPEEASMHLLHKPVAPHWLPRFGMPIPKDELMSWQRFVDLAYWHTDISE
ncbi:MAG TPA: HNH endonuclease [Candidatus Hydrogenedentes bacterium]|nr:HNH endonuclease [Candidatus Hydrogenedentota bacterium]